MGDGPLAHFRAHLYSGPEISLCLCVVVDFFFGGGGGAERVCSPDLFLSRFTLFDFSV